jgi:hypothetical protein
MKFALISMIFAGVALGAVPAMGKAAKHAAAPKKEAAKDTASAGLTGLLHASPDRVKARLGDPAIARAEGKGAFWTYRAPRCALYIFFKDTASKTGGGLQVSGAAVGPRQRGVAYADLDTCLAELERSQAGAGQ